MDLSALLNPFVFLTIIMGVLIFYSQWFETPSSILRPLPGPRGWSILGNLLDLLAARWDINELHRRLVKAYGAVVSYRIFGHRVVVISDQALARQALEHGDMCGRMRDEWRQKLSERRHVGILTACGNSWKEHREVVIKFLADIVESGHLEKVCCVDAEIYSESVDLYRSIVFSISNILCQLLFGKKYDDETLNELTDLLIKRREEAKTAGVRSALYALLPSFFRKLPFIGRREKRRLDTELVDLIGRLMDERDGTPSTSSEQCLMNMYRKEMEERWNKMEYNQMPSLSNASLLWTCYDLLNISVDQTAQLLHQAIVLTERNPNVRARITDVGKPLIATISQCKDQSGKQSANMAADRMTNTKWRPSDCAYVNAVLLETKRFESREKCGGGDWDWTWATSRVAEADIELGNDYDIPQGSVVITTTFAKDTKDEDFRPERFLTTDGMLVDSPAMKVFGTGKRACPAKAVASTLLRVLLCKNFANASDERLD